MSSPNSFSQGITSNDIKIEENGDSVKQRCLELQKKISKVETDTSLLSLAITRSSRAVKRLRTEYLVLVELLEKKSQAISSGKEQESPSSPELEAEDINQFLQSSLSRLTARHQGFQLNLNKKSALFTAKRGPRKIKDPNFPKRPTNAYLLYCEGEKERIKSLPVEDQEKIPDLSKHLTEGWKSLDEEGRKPYYKVYEQDKERFTRELEEYEKKKLLEQTAASGTSQPVAADTPEVEDDELAHPLIKKIKLEELQFPSVSPQQTESPTPTPVMGLNQENEDDVTGVEDEEEEEEEEEDDDVTNSILPNADEGDELEEDDDMEVDESIVPDENDEENRGSVPAVDSLTGASSTTNGDISKEGSGDDAQVKLEN